MIEKNINNIKIKFSYLNKFIFYVNFHFIINNNLTNILIVEK